MEILFLIPPIKLNRKRMFVDRVYGCNYGFDYKPAIHLLLLATIAEQSGCRIRFLDCPGESYNFKKFTNYIAHNSSIDIVVFFTVWLSWEEDIVAAEIISNLIKKVKIIFTGSYPTWKPDIFLRKDNYFVIRGEPETTLSEFIKLYKSEDDGLLKIKNLSFLGRCGIINNDPGELMDINSIPIPNRKLLKGRYFFNRIDTMPTTVMCVSRGCSYNCNYCAPNALDQAIELEYFKNNSQKPPLRLRSVDNIVKEFKEIASLAYRGIEICDNQFVWDKKRTMEICEGIKHLNLKWICYARADHLKDKDMLNLMREAGCKLIYIGTESFNQEILDDINKEMSLKDIYVAVELLKECGIEAEVSVLLGGSGLETEKTILHSIQEAKKLKTCFIHYSIALPLPNTHLYKISKETGWIKTGEFIPVDNVREALLDLPYIKAERLKVIIRKCYARQYLSVRFIARQILNTHFLKRFIFKIRTLAKLLKFINSK